MAIIAMLEPPTRKNAGQSQSEQSFMEVSENLGGFSTIHWSITCPDSVTISADPTFLHGIQQREHFLAGRSNERSPMTKQDMPKMAER